MASCATGLSVRFFSVTIPFGTLMMGSATGGTFRTTRGKAQDERAEYRQERPVASRLTRPSGDTVVTLPSWTRPSPARADFPDGTLR